MLVNDWMTPSPLSVESKDSLMHARVLMKRHNLRHLPVLADGKVTGVVSDRDLRDYTPSYCTSLDVYEMHYMISKLTVDDAMTPHPVTVTPETPIFEAGELMLKKRIGCLPVEKDGKLVGMLTESDLIRALVTAERRLSPAPELAPAAGDRAVDAQC